ncbi:MAG: DUF5686 family protein [Massilibacteroides sp.]|nr:DUF5686 family protein [Massilibacteroides sp.]MDD4659870.1 DUF5686 family protein [Massilibacteroides sp.]
MKNLFLIVVLFSVTFYSSVLTVAENRKHTYSVLDSTATSRKTADSIMCYVISNAAFYEKVLSKYEADIYIKGRTEILKSNALVHFLHHIYPINKKNRDMLFEMHTHSQYKAPNSYIHKIEAINGNSIPDHKKQQEVLAFLNINAYSSTLYKDELLTPFVSEAFSYYHFYLLGSEVYEGVTIYKIRFVPKYASQKLLFGDVYVTDKKWTIDKIDISGKNTFQEFNLVMTFNRDEKKFILPENATLKLKTHFFGNVIESNYYSDYNYKMVEWAEVMEERHRKNLLDLTNYYSVLTPEVPIIRDSAYWDKYRNVPLTTDEKALYQDRDVLNQNRDTTRSSRYWEITDNLIGSINMDVRNAQLRYSGFLNPLQFGYSRLNGITYRQKLRLAKNLKNERQIRFQPELGFIFKRKEVFLKLAGEFEYCPDRFGYLRFSIGNTYQSYSSAFMEEIKEQAKDSIFDFDNLNLPYFRTYFVDLRHNIELFHGFQWAVGLSYYHRTPSEKKNLIEEADISDLVNKDYNDFTPVFNFTYTPRQYYRMIGRKKEYIYSYYPTISIELARGVPNILNSNGDYCRVETNVQQMISLGLCRNLSYNISAGLYTNQKSIYFADFRYFGQDYFPDRWSEETGGKFHLLKREWYNASDKYLQGHFMYESPFILLHLFKQRMSRYVLSERFYFGQLWTPVLDSYTEIGYGIGNHIFNVAGFVSFKGEEYQRFGIRFAFELF